LKKKKKKTQDFSTGNLFFISFHVYRTNVQHIDIKIYYVHTRLCIDSELSREIDLNNILSRINGKKKNQ